MEILAKIIPVFFCFQLHQICANTCTQNSRRLMGSSGVVSSYNFPFDNDKQDHGCIYTYQHNFEGFDWDTVKEICFQFKRFNLSGDSKLYIDGEYYRERGVLSMSNLCVPVTLNFFFMFFDGTERNMGFFATYYVVTDDANATSNNLMELTANLPIHEENVFCNSSDLFQCFDGKKCISSNLQCDGEFHCDDRSDEAYATARCVGARGQNSSFRAVNVSSLPADFSDYRVTVFYGWAIEDYSRDFHYGPTGPHVSGYYFRTNFLNLHTPSVPLIYEIEDDLYKDNTSYCLTFWYHMNGKDAGRLQVFWGPQANRQVWQRLGDFKSVWLKAEVQRVPTAWDRNEIVFAAHRGSTESTQIAIQDISVMPGPCHSNADYELADDISCTFEDGMCRWINESDWIITNGTDISTAPEAEGSFYLKPADSSSLILKSPFLTKGHSSSCLIIRAYSTGDNHMYMSRNDGLEIRYYHIYGKPEWQMFKLPIERSQDPDRVILRFERDGIFLDDFVYAEQACNNIDAVKCGYNDYMCSEKLNCLTSTQRCNGKRDCLWGDDEDDCEYCINNAYKCENSTCIESKYRCDGVAQCISGSDEEYCGHCENGAFRCQNAQCVPAGSQCDGIEQCRDGSDEWNCEPKCESNEYLCDGSSECIGTFRVCDGHKDCINGDDEYHCNSCKNLALHCDNNQCVPYGSKCDGETQCDDGSDERNCNWCYNGAYLCNNGHCVPKGSRCDGIAQCLDSSDEQGCSQQSFSFSFSPFIIASVAITLVLLIFGVTVSCVVRRSKRRQRSDAVGIIQGGEALQYDDQIPPDFAAAMQPPPGYLEAVNNPAYPPPYMASAQANDELHSDKDDLPSYDIVSSGNFVQLTVPVEEDVARMRQQMAPSTDVTQGGDTEAYTNSAYQAD